MKERLDIYLTENSMAKSREEARALIMSGIVYVNDMKSDKAGTMIDMQAKVEVRGEKNPFVSRGGLKLQKAMELWKIDLTHKVALDIGASSGGFTDCMLQNGAKKVYAVDVGTNQLVYKLRCDERVVSIEKTNFRTIDEDFIKEKVDFFSEDVSFISVLKLCDSLEKFVHEGTMGVVLIKPQFESCREEVGKGGVVKDIHIHKKTVKKVVLGLSEFGWFVKDLSFSPITGPKGNIEFLAYVSRKKVDEHISIDDLIDSTVDRAHSELK